MEKMSESNQSETKLNTNVNQQNQLELFQNKALTFTLEKSVSQNTLTNNKIININSKSINMAIETLVTNRAIKYSKDLSPGICNRNLIKIDLHKLIYNYPVILYSNIRSIANKFDQVEFTTLKYKPDVAIFVETWVSDERVNAYPIDNYTVIHKIRNRPDKKHGGGIAFYIKKEISIQSIKLPLDNFLDVLTITIRPKLLPRNIPWFAIIAVYYPPLDIYHTNLRNYIMEEIDRLFAINPRAEIYIIGDFNDLNTKFLSNLYSFKQIINYPTRKTSLLDKCFTNVSFKNDVEILPPIDNSDHNLIKVSPFQSLNYKNNNKSILCRPKKIANINRMGVILCKMDWSPIYFSSDIESATNFFHHVIYLIYDECFPLITKRINNKSPSWVNKDLTDLFNSRNEAFRNKDINGYNSINTKIKTLIGKTKQEWFSQQLAIKPMNKSHIHSVIKSLICNNSEKQDINFPGKSVEESFEEIFEYFASLANAKQHSNQTLYVKNNTSFSIPLIEKDYVYKSLCKITSKTKSAPDFIPDFIWNQYAIELTDPITSLINLSLMSDTCPKLWKSSTLIPIPKVNSPKEPQQIRPISISTPIVKICEKYILQHIFPIVASKLDPFQLGGVPNKSSAQYLSIYIDRIVRELEDTNNSACSIITDFTKAFDNLDHDMFLKKLNELLPLHSAYNWIASFLTNRIQWMRSPVNDFAKCFSVTKGVPQGSVLGSFIFALLINDVAHNCKYSLKYVDDMTITCIIQHNNVHHPQEIINSVVEQVSLVNLKFNPIKCCILNHDFKKIKNNIPQLSMDNVQLRVVDSVSILGVWIQKDLRWNTHVENICKKANRVMFLIYRLKRLGGGIQIMKLAYTTYIRSIVEYCAPVWSHSLTLNQINTIESIQKRACKVILGNDFINYEYALIKLNFQTLYERRNMLSYNFAKKFFCTFPQFLPITQGSLSKRTTRGTDKLILPKARTNRLEKSPIINAINIINNS